ncbi:8617_t:CDS:2 [Paraglomus occultum]|uniref:Late endosomal/lysosomal adaptor and MAPK and MTOR activator 5 n=1 Tax=Paraglomus occultum TaxID=144539 RepID=A0A9N9GNJ7_9GLOM|nr:8617_t:CDS:2 [Paraglomus occultum]
MESAIDSVLEGLSKADNVKGVLVADGNGLCIGARGIANPSLSGYVVAVAEQAKDLADVSSELPVVKIESETA